MPSLVFSANAHTRRVFSLAPRDSQGNSCRYLVTTMASGKFIVVAVYNPQLVGKGHTTVEYQLGIRFIALLRIHAFALVCLAFCSPVFADPLTTTIEQFIQQQTANLPGEVSYTIGQIEGQKKLPPCQGYQAFFPNNSQQLGNTSLGVRCLMPSTWTIYVPIKINVMSHYIVSSHGLAAGQVITSSDIQENRGNIVTLPPGVLLKPDQAIGKTTRFAIAAGQPLRSEQLTAPILVKQNQSIRLIVDGPGFTAGAEGKALNNASEGQVVQVRTPSGTTVSGIAQADGSVRISYGK